MEYKSKYLWLLDNGHGRDTKGKRSPVWDDGTQLFEFKFNRDVIDNLGLLLDQDGIEYTLICPELKDVSLKERCRRANSEMKRSSKPTIFISVHGNAFTDSNVKGAETHHYPNSEEGKRLSHIMQKHLVKYSGFNDRGLKESKFKVLRSTKMPAMLTENGFYSNFEECKKMMTNKYKRLIAYGHYAAIREIEGID
jgi:N-acetylmuramoyl-L-alanine amidase